MESLATVITSIFIGVAIGYILQFLTPRSQLVAWRSHGFVFGVQNPPNPDIAITTEALTVQNTGKKLAERIEIARAAPPTVFHIWPNRRYNVDTSSGPHVIQIDTLGPNEWFVVEFLAIGTAIPQLLYIRSQDGQAQWIAIQPQRVWPKWYTNIMVSIFFVGAAFLTYWIVRAVQYLSHKILWGR